MNYNIGALAADNRKIERKLSYAKMHGKDENGKPYKFITLILISMDVDPEYFENGGVDDLRVTEYVGKKGRRQFHFEKTGGAIKFKENGRNYETNKKYQ